METQLRDDARSALRDHVLADRRLGLSARGFDRVRRVARTLADLAGRSRVETGDVAEALRYRSTTKPTC